MSFDNPFAYFENWFNEAHDKIDSNPNAVTIASCDLNGKPSARMVLLRGHSEEGFVFFTNYNSRKAKELLENPNVSMLFYWRGLERQIRIEGRVEKTDATTSDNYWKSRHPDSQANSTFSKQSSVMGDPKKVEEELKTFKESLNGEGTPRPNNWGGFILKPEYFEFWSEGANRWHRRDSFSLNQEHELWQPNRLYP